MFNFDLKRTAIFYALKWGKFPIFRFAKFFKKFFFLLFLILAFLFLYGFLSYNFSSKSCSILLGFSIISLTLALAFWQKELFFNLKLKRPSLKLLGFGEPARLVRKAILNPEKFNLAEFLSYEVAKAVLKAENFAKSKKFSQIDSSLLLYFLLKENSQLNFIFSRALLDKEEIKKILKSYFKLPKNTLCHGIESRDISFSREFQDSILEALKIAQKRNHQRIEIGDMITALAKHDFIFKKILIEANLKGIDIENLTEWLEYLEKKIEKRKRFWDYENLLKKGTLAKEWVAGYTITLDRFSIDWTKIIKKSLPEIFGHQKEIKQIERILAQREKNNVLLIGEPGTGRKSIIEGIAKLALLGQSLPEINYKRVVELDLPALISQLETQEEISATLDKIFQEVVLAGNIILVIDKFHNYVGGERRPGVIDISGILSSYLALPQFQIIAISTYLGLHKYIEQNPSILDLFEKVEVSEISQKETLRILENLALFFEKKYKKFISYPALSATISLAARYLPSLSFPEKAIELLEQTVIHVASFTKEKIVLPKHVEKIISERTQIPVGEIEEKEREILLNLENLLHQRIVDQQEAVKEISAALRRARAQITERKRPIGSFLFLGPTGVGKTETSKALAQIYFGSEERMIRLDMSEFQRIEDIPRLIGSSDFEGLLTTPVRENPFSLILLDEIEKAHPNILNLFLQVLDEGHLTDGLERKVDFKNTIIIATSNAGYKIILKALKEKINWKDIKEKLLDYLFEKAIFRPEFINRFDGVILFSPLSKENLLEISELMLQKLKKDLKEKEIEFSITKALKEKIVELGYSPIFGARQMRRVIQDKIENPIAVALLAKKLKRGEKIEIDPEKFEILKKLV